MNTIRRDGIHRSVVMARRASTALLMVAGAAAAIEAPACSRTQTQATNKADSGLVDSVDAGPGAEAPVPPNVAQPDCRSDPNNWPMFGQNICNTASSPTGAGMSKRVAQNLTEKWAYSAAGEVSATPAVADGSVYFPDWSGMLTKLDAKTGKVTWTKSVTSLLAAANGTTDTGFSSRTTPVVTNDSVIFGTLGGGLGGPGGSAFVVSVNKDTGAVQWATPVHGGHPAAVVSGSAVYDGTRVYFGVSSIEEGYPHFVPGYTCCSFRGSVVAVDATTGAIVWQTHTISDSVYYEAGVPSDGGALSGYAGVAIWSSTPVVDLKRKQLYVTTGNNYSAPSGAPGSEPGNAPDAVLALDLETGAIKWAQSVPEGGRDVWSYLNSDNNLPFSQGQDSDFGAGANLFTAMVHGVMTDLVGAGQKSGLYFALDADTGSVVWQTQVSPPGHLGGIHWGTATDGNRIYVAGNDTFATPWVLGGKGPHAGETVTTGAWSALDPSTGEILWQTPDPALSKPLDGVSLNSPVTVLNGVLFGGSMDAAGTMFALDADDGTILWSFKSGGTVYGGPAVAGGTVYWGSGYPSTRTTAYVTAPYGQLGGFGTSSKKLYAFAAP
jgi:polyvinyl alcohol dehydrogenase (cytochrome)